MATSLARQLQRLKAPQTQALVPTKKGISILFDAKEAGNTSIDEAFELGLEGLKELEKLDSRFKEFEHLLFSHSAKSLQRAVQSKEVNTKLDEHVRRFLLLLTPHLLLKPALSALEWLVKRFRIGEYNMEEMILCSLPYHGSRTFVLLVRAAPTLKDPQSPWHFLLPVADTGTPMDTQALHAILAKNLPLLRKLCTFTISAYKTYPRNEANKLQVLFTFTCSAVLGVLSHGCNQASLACILPLLRTGLGCATSSLAAGCLAVAAHVAARAPLAERVSQEILTQLFNPKVTSLQREAASVLLLMFTAQPRLGGSVSLPASLVSRMSSLFWLPKALAEIAVHSEGKQVSVLPLVLPLLAALLEEVHKLPDEKAKSAAQLASQLLGSLTFTPSQASEVIRVMFSKLPEGRKKNIKSKVKAEVYSWFRAACQNLETSYPQCYDAETQRVLEKHPKIGKRLKNILQMQLVNLNDEGVVLTPRGLITRMLHPEAAMRVAAVASLGEAYPELSDTDRNWASEALKERLLDEDMNVILAVLQLPCLRDVMGGDESLVEALVNLLDSKPYRQWRKKTLAAAMKLLCSSVQEDEGEMRQACLLMAMLPPLVMHPSLLSTVAASEFSHFCPLLQTIVQSIESGGEAMQNSKMWLMWAAQKAMGRAPPESLELVAWRLQREGTVTGLELLLLCRMLSAAAPHLTDNKAALHCVRLLNNIRQRADKVLPLRSEEFPPPSQSKLVEQAFEAVVTQDALPMEAVLAVLRSLASRALTRKKKSPRSVLRWCDLSCGDDLTEENLELSTSLLCLFLELSTQQISTEVTPSAYGLHTFLQTNFKDVNQQFHLLSLLWGLPGTKDGDLIRSIKFCKMLVQYYPKQAATILQLEPEDTFIPSLLCLACHEKREVRTAASNLLKELALCCTPTTNYHCLIVAIVAHDLELLEDQDHLSMVFYTLLSPDNTVQGFLRSQQAAMLSASKCLLQHCCSPLTPRHVSKCLLHALRHVNNEDIVADVSSLGLSLLSKDWPDQELDEQSWQVLGMVLERLQDECAALALKQESVWTLMEKALSSKLKYREQHVVTTTLSNISADMFAKLGAQLQSSLVTLILSVQEAFSREILTTLRKLPLDKPLLEEQLSTLMLPTPKPRTRKSAALTETTTPITASDNWRRGLILLESLQEKRKLQKTERFLPTLFKILKVCMEMGSEQEYSKQLVLGCLSNCVKTTDASNSPTFKTQNQLDVELLVQCLRGTTNPHTQRQALLLLAQTAHTLPEGLLHHLVSVFTFMGSLVMRHDDSYSFHVIAEVIDKLVPVIVKAQNGANAVVSVLRVFVDAMPDIPSHRRGPIFAQLMQVLGWQRLWLFLSLVSEAPAEIEEGQPKHRNLKTIIALELMSSCPLPALLAACTSTLSYLSALTIIKYGEQKQVLNAAEIRDKLQQCGAEKLHDPTVRPAGETKRLQASCLSLLTDILAARNSPEQQENEEENTEEELYRALMEALMSYIGLVTKQEQVSRGQGTSKFWPAMLHYAYTLLNKVNLLLPTRQFLGVVRGVLESSTGDEGVRARALEVLGARLQLRAAAQLSPHERLELLALVPSLKALSLSEAGPAAERALFCLRILSKQLASTTPHTFTPVLTTLIQALENETMTTAILAGMLLCVAELVSGLRAAAVPSLPRLVPLVLKFSSQHRAGQDPNELVLLGTAATLQRLVETLPNFLSPFLPGVLRELCLLSAATPSHVSVRANAVLNPRLTAIRGGVGRIPLRILLPATTTVFSELRAESISLPALGPLLSVLSASFADLERTHVDAHIAELTTFFISALELRADWDAKDLDEEDQKLVTEAEDHVITALVALVMKLPETLFRPLYFQLSAWSSEAEQSLHLRSRCITFYRCSTSLANSLKGLFVVFAFYFLKQAAGLLRRCHSSVNQGEEPLFPSEGQICQLLESVLETLLAVCSHDKQNFVNKECFDAIMQPLVDQLENMVGGEERLRERCSRLVAPCLAQFARATADDMLWKQLHYQILLKTRHTSPTVRLVSVGAIKSLAGALGEELLPLLPEAVPFLAELLEDEDTEVETACQDAVRDLERILGEPLHKYF